MRYSRFSTKHLEQVATEIRSKHGKFDGKRLIVESLVDSLGFQIITAPGLKEEFGIDAYIPKKPNTIIVDQSEYDYCEPRLYFTLTEEIAHSVIHYHGSGAAPNTLQEWISTLNEADYNALEQDAKHLAGAILMPAKEFTELFKKYRESQATGLGKHGDHQTTIRYAIRHLYYTYGVSFDAAANRALCLELISKPDITVLRRYKTIPSTTVSRLLPHLSRK